MTISRTDVYIYNRTPNHQKLFIVSFWDIRYNLILYIFFVGHMSDPDDLPGLAHFCEHMLFLGTEKVFID